jgi:hypothetical protein
MKRINMNTKICNKCGIEKEYSEFHKNKDCIGGVRNTCKECRKQEKTEYLSREYVKEKNKQHYIDNKVAIRKRTKAHYWTINGQYHQYKKRAKKSNIVFELTEKDCTPFYNTNCAYCGTKINGLGIDRVDNSKGYILSNVVPCCSKCNFMKYTLSKQEFFNHIVQIIKYQNLNL